MPSTVVLRTVEQDYSLATWDRVILQLWRGPVSSTSLSELRVLTKKFKNEVQGAICSLSVVEPSSPPPSDELRSGLSAFYRENANIMPQQIVVAEGGGFRSALVRSVGIALSAFAPKMLPFKFVGSVQDAAIMISPYLSANAGGTKGLVDAVEQLRQQMHTKSKAKFG